MKYGLKNVKCPKKFFLIILVLFLNSFDIVKSEEFLSYCPSMSKKDFTTGTKEYSEIILSDDTEPADLIEFLHIETDTV